MRLIRLTFFSLFLFTPFLVSALQVTLPEVIVQGTDVRIEVAAHYADTLWVNGLPTPLESEDGVSYFTHRFVHTELLHVRSGEDSFLKEVDPLPLWWSVVPPLLAILLAFVTREVFLSLFLGIFSGTAAIGWYHGGFTHALGGFLRIFDTYVLEALSDKGHLSIIVFSMTIGATVTVVSKNGGMQAVVNGIARFARNARSGQLATYVLGLVIFFDDYANTLVVGNTMRSVTDRLHVSREKLAYLVDSTAAPIAALAFVTTWIGAELSYIEDGVGQIDGWNEGAYSVFLNSLGYSYYPLLTLFFVFAVIWTQRDFGPMLSVERKARSQENEHTLSEAAEQELTAFQPKVGIPLRAFNAWIPIGIIVVGTLLGLLYTGWDPTVWKDPETSWLRKLSITIGRSDSYQALLWSSLTGLSVALLLTIGQRILSIREAMESAISGYKTMLTAMMILALAWSLAHLTDQLHTADFLRTLWSDSLPPELLPAVTFLLAALVSFSTGSSWGTMAILYPLLLPTGYAIAQEAGWAHADIVPVFYNITASVLAGSVLGDHCSPISDTTILSSLSAGCDHIQHVRTQMPYALTVGAVALFLGVLPAGFGVPGWILFPLALVALWFSIRWMGRRVT